jgi:hypothetical protein
MIDDKALEQLSRYAALLKDGDTERQSCGPPSCENGIGTPISGSMLATPGC